MRCQALAIVLAAVTFASTASAQEWIEPEKNVFEGDFLIVGIGAALAPTYEGSDNSKVIPVLGATGELHGVGFTVRGPSLSIDFASIELGRDVTLGMSAQFRYRPGRSGNLKDDPVERLGKVDGVLEAGGRIGLGFEELLSRKDKLSVGVSARWDVSGKGSGYVVTPSATYRLPLSRAQAIGVLVSTQFVDGDYADYNFSISPEGSANSGLPVYDAKGGFKEWTVGFGTARDLNGNVLDGGFSISGGVLYTRLYGSAARSPITSVRGSRDQWFFGTGLAYIF